MTSRKPISILVVDDDPDSLDLISDTLSSSGHTILSARSGPEAIRVLREQPIDLAIIDVCMPDMNGFALLEVIRSTPGREELPVILQTADPSRENGARAFDAHLSFMLAKPLDTSMLIAAVRHSLQTVEQSLQSHAR